MHLEAAWGWAFREPAALMDDFEVQSERGKGPPSR